MLMSTEATPIDCISTAASRISSGWDPKSWTASGESAGRVSISLKAFERRSSIDNITAVTPGELEITKDGGDVVISFAYAQKIPLFANVSLLIDFAASTAPGGGADKQ